MTIEFKLDTAALSSLIEKDDTFKVSIQQAVLQNIANRYIKSADNNLTKIFQVAADEYQKRQLESIGKIVHYNKFELNDDIKRQLRKAIKDESASLVDDAIKNAVEQSLKDINKRIDEKIAIAVNSYTEQAVDKLLQEKFTKAYKKLQATL